MPKVQTWERKIIEAGYRQLAKRNHPDKGGSPETMAALNSAVKNLRAVDEWAQRDATGFPATPPPETGQPYDADPLMPVLRNLADAFREIFEPAQRPKPKRPRRRSAGTGV